jgi:caa(3)-type oxidase subunit IV
MSEFHDPYPNYEMMAHHDEATGKKIRKKLWRVFWLLLGVTIAEIIIGIYASDAGLSPLALKVIFITLTVFKAFYIVYTFMHLKEETRATKWIIIGPFTGFILYLIFMVTIGEGKYTKLHRLDGPIPDEQVEQMLEHNHKQKVEHSGDRQPVENHQQEPHK